MRSLTLKLTLAFLVVGLVGSVVVAGLIRIQTQRELDRFMLSVYQGEFYNNIVSYYKINGSWDGIDNQPIFKQYGPGRNYHEHVLVVDTNNRVVLGPYPYAGKFVKEFDKRLGIPIEVDGKTVGWMIVGDMPMLPGSPEAEFLERMTFNILVSGILAAILALATGFLLARTISHPIRDLRKATQVVAGGNLGYQVPVRTKDELGQLAMSFNKMSADLARSNNLRRQMTADVAHELRNPLSVILGYTEALSESKLNGSPSMFGVMHDEALNLQRLIEDLRTLSLADAGELSLHKQNVAPASLLERVAIAHTPHAQEKQVSLEVHANADLPELSVDPDRIAQVLGNLVTNALRYTPAKGRIELSAERQNGGVVLRVADTGKGIDVADLPYIFERFYKADKSRHFNGSESGLGLAIAKSIIEAHGGSIRVESTPGKGTTFAISLASAG